MQRVRELLAMVTPIFPREFSPKENALSVNNASHTTAHWMSENPLLGETLASVEKASNRTLTFSPIQDPYW